MRTYDYSTIKAERCSPAVADLLALVASDIDRMQAVQKNHPSLIASLKPAALFDNVDASARIEGIYLAPERIAQLIEGAEPLRGAESQVAGYARILKALDQSPDFFTVSTSTLLAMHTVLFTGERFDTRSRYRRKDYADMVDSDGAVHRVPVSPITAYETPLHLGALCDSLWLALSHADARTALLIIPHAVLDFLCIRPFDKGNGRLARLFAYQLMTQNGIDICRNVSVDRLCEHDAMSYYNALNAGIEGWEDGEGDYDPFTLYWLGKVHKAYSALLERPDLTEQTADSKTERVRLFLAGSTGPITKKDIAQANPDISISTIENALHDLLAEGAITMIGAGRSTAYEYAKPRDH